MNAATLFEKSKPGRICARLPECDSLLPDIPENLLRQNPPGLPEVSEIDIVRHYTWLSRRAFGVDNGFYPLGSCTMKYNPKLGEDVASLPGFTGIHPLQPAHTVEGCIQIEALLKKLLCEISGMDAYTLQPAAGAQGEITGLLMIRAYHKSRGDTARTKVLIPDSAHGTNPASAAVAGYTVVNIPSNLDGRIDIEALARAAGSDTAALMLTNPNTLGLFEDQIEAAADIMHKAGALLYYDGANLNAIMGIARPGDMGFDVCHVNLHKTFGTPHGMGGPGSGPVGCKAALAPFLPVSTLHESCENDCNDMSIGRVKNFYGNFLVCVRALSYITTLGAEGLRHASEMAVLHANVLKRRLETLFGKLYDGACMHEFVVSLDGLKKETGVTALDVAKAMLEAGVHPPTIYFPLIVREALMIEPTETESLETLNAFTEIVTEIYRQAHENPEAVKNGAKYPRLDEVRAARAPKLRT